MGGYLPGYPDIARAILLYARALDISAKIRMREIQLVTREMASHIADLLKSPSERYKLSVCIKGSCTTCIQAALYNFYGLPHLFVLGRLIKEEEEETKMEKIAVFPYITLAMYFRQFVSVIGYIVTRTRWSDT